MAHNPKDNTATLAHTQQVIHCQGATIICQACTTVPRAAVHWHDMVSMQHVAAGACAHGAHNCGGCTAHICIYGPILLSIMYGTVSQLTGTQPATSQLHTHLPTKAISTTEAALLLPPSDIWLWGITLLPGVQQASLTAAATSTGMLMQTCSPRQASVATIPQAQAQKRSHCYGTDHPSTLPTRAALPAATTAAIIPVDWPVATQQLLARKPRPGYCAC